LVCSSNLHCGVRLLHSLLAFFFFQAEDGIRDRNVTGVQTCALPISTIILTLYLKLSCRYITLFIRFYNLLPYNVQMPNNVQSNYVFLGFINNNTATYIYFCYNIMNEIEGGAHALLRPYYMDGG